MVIYRFKVVIVGEPAVGKTSLVKRACKKPFPEEYNITIGVDVFSWQKLFNSVLVTLSVWDLGGQERFIKIQPEFYRGAHAVVLCFDLTDPETIELLKRKWWDNEIQNAKENMDRNVKFYLVGTKSDLKQKVPEEKIRELADNIGDQLAYVIKTSAKTGENVDELFEKIAMDLMK